MPWLNEGDLLYLPTALPLRSSPDEAKISGAMEAIRGSLAYLTGIPIRPSPYVPAHHAARFTYGRCAAFAEALQEKTGLEPVALLARRFSPRFEGTKRGGSGYVPNFVMHPDGSAEDAWGKAPITAVASRFGVMEFEVSEAEHRRVVGNLQRNSTESYVAAVQDARELIAAYRAE